MNFVPGVAFAITAPVLKLLVMLIF